VEQWEQWDDGSPSYQDEHGNWVVPALRLVDRGYYRLIPSQTPAAPGEPKPQNSEVEPDPQKRSDTSGDKDIKTPEVKEQPDPNGGKLGKCFEGWRFSTAASEPFRGTRFHGAAQGIAGFLEIGPPISLGADATATAYKATQTTLGKPQPYASGFSWGIRRIATGSLRGQLTSFWERGGSGFLRVGAFTAGYNLSVTGQCLFGVIK
jgi:hypothetical protein